MNRFSDDDFKRLIADLKAHAAEYSSKEQASIIRRTIAALIQFTAGRKPSLDHAFGLVERRGKRISNVMFDLACQAYHLKYRAVDDEGESLSLTWEQVTDKLDPDVIENYRLSGDDIKKLVNRNRAAIELHFFKIETMAAMEDE